MEWFLKVVRDNYANFTGRARRKEYWMFTLFNFILSLLFVIPMLIGAFSENMTIYFIGFALYMLFALALLIPSLAVCVRRLHDVGKSGWWYLISFVPIIGTILLLIWFCTDSEIGENQWGPDPKAGEIGH